MDRICGAIFDEEGEEGIDLVNKEDDNGDEGKEEDGEPAPHFERGSRRSSWRIGRATGVRVVRMAGRVEVKET